MTTYANPGAIADVAADVTYLEATWGNAARDRLVNNFATAAARTAAIVVPVVGMASVINDIATTNLGFHVYAGATDGWVAPWNLPWGYVTSATISANQTLISALADITNLTVTATALANRRWKIELVQAFSISQVTTTGVTAVTIATGSTGAGTQLAATQCTIVAAAQGAPGPLSAIVTTTAGSLSYHCRCSTTAGTATINAAATTPWVLLVEDIGPAGVPS